MIKAAAKTVKPTLGFTIINGAGTIYSKKKLCYELGTVYARANTEGFATPGPLEKFILNDFIRHEKKSGLFQKTDLYLLFCYNQTELSGFSRINLKNPQGNLAIPYGGMTYTLKGWKGNGIDAYIETDFNPSVGINNYTLNNACRGMVVSVAAGGVLDGTTAHNRLYNQNSSTHRINTSTSPATSANMAGTGLKVIARENNTSTYLINSAAQSTVLSTSVSIGNYNQLLFRTGSSTYGSSTLANYFMGAAISYGQSQSHRANINSLMKKYGLIPIA